ncbi:LytR/AlgR family response regulator transcription factor [Faecalibacter macacae]|uniref:DNA-binding response regulator n=1 Tax=Faecalibacter macacae TaxID=1859289 RepID=A0A3L9MM96_9FLAO|nr:response regulator transcription factor [Faecalibacter macacae]RLZ12314.1 DNA-binding response regulator [Faecalibacter macacae]
MNKLKCIIIDDEPLAVELLENYARENQYLDLVFSTTEVFEAINFLKSTKVDLIFTDIQMPDLTGIQLMKVLDQTQKFILTTAYPDYALESFNYNVIDYLLKPISKEKFDQSVIKFMELFSIKKSIESNYIFVKSDGRQVKLFFDDILYIEGLKDYLKIYTKTFKILVLETMKSFEEKLPQNFQRIHRSYTINTDCINAVDGNSVYISDQLLPIGETYRKDFKKIFL